MKNVLNLVETRKGSNKFVEPFLDKDGKVTERGWIHLVQITQSVSLRNELFDNETHCLLSGKIESLERIVRDAKDNNNEITHLGKIVTMEVPASELTDAMIKTYLYPVDKQDENFNQEVYDRRLDRACKRLYSNAMAEKLGIDESPIFAFGDEIIYRISFIDHKGTETDTFVKHTNISEIEEAREAFKAAKLKASQPAATLPKGKKVTA